MKFAVSHLLAGLAFAALSSNAATFEALDFDQLSTRAEQIFIGTVVASTPVTTARGEIVTDFAFRDLETVKGAVQGAEASVRMLGGNDGARFVHVPGAPTFRVGQRYLVFIEGNGRVMFPTLGGSQGVFRMELDKASGRTMVLDYGGRPVTTLPSGSGLLARPKAVTATTDYAPQAVPFTKEAFVAEIEKRIGAGR